MGHGRRTKFLLAVATISLSCSFVGAAQDTESLSPVHAYQIESQYGPEVAVLNTIYEKNKTFEFYLNGSYSSTSSLYDYIGAGLGLAYHINRRHSVEAWAQYNLYREMSSFAISEIKDKYNQSGGKKAGLGIDIPKMMTSLAYSFTPYYTKMHLTDASVISMDINILAGPCFVLNEQERFDGQGGETQWNIGGMAGIGIRVLSRSRWGFRFELRNFLHQAENVGSTEIVNNMQLSGGVSMFLDRFPDYWD